MNCLKSFLKALFVAVYLVLLFFSMLLLFTVNVFMMCTPVLLKVYVCVPVLILNRPLLFILLGGLVSRPPSPLRNIRTLYFG